MSRIILISQGTRGDVYPFLALGQALRSREHDVILATHPVHAKIAGEIGLDFLAVDTPEEFDKMMASIPLLNEPTGYVEFSRQHILPKIRRICEDLRSRAPDAACVVAKPVGDWAGGFLSELLKIPLAWLYLSPNQAEGLSMLGSMALQFFADDLNILRRGLGLVEIENWMRWLDEATAQIGAWPSWFSDQDESNSVSLDRVGFFLEREEVGGPESDSFRDHILITGGSGITAGRQFFSVAIAGCVALGERAVVVTPERHLLPDRLPPLVVWKDRVHSMSALMPRVRAVIHHGGIGTVGEAFRAGVPQLAMALGGGRPDTARRMQATGVGVSLLPNQWTEMAIARALHRLLTAGAALRAKELAGILSGEEDGAEAACQVLERVITARGADRESDR